VPCLEQLHAQALDWRIQADLHEGRHQQLIPELQELTARHPLREHVHGQPMLALYRCGRQAEALAAYQHVRDVLAAELGVEPAPGLRDLHQRILSADPALAVTEPARSAEAEPQRGTPRELPPALRVAAELAASRPAALLAELASELADLRSRLDLLAASGDPRTQVRVVFSWSHRQLDAQDARTFRLLGLHPGPDLEPYAAAALTGAAIQQARQALDMLTRAHLIQSVAPGRHGMHDLLRSYARELAVTEDTEAGQHAALTRLLDHYLHTAAEAMNTVFPAERDRRPRIPRPASRAHPGPARRGRPDRPGQGRGGQVGTAHQGSAGDLLSRRTAWLDGHPRGPAQRRPAGVPAELAGSTARAARKGGRMLVSW
jgi:transcriptional activator